MVDVATARVVARIDERQQREAVALAVTDLQESLDGLFVEEERRAGSVVGEPEAGLLLADRFEGRQAVTQPLRSAGLGVRGDSGHQPESEGKQ